jgi:RND family efflux transporter MFP subunit
MVDVGTMVSPGMAISNIVDVSTLKVKVNVGEHEAFQLKAGDKVEISTDVYPNEKFDGRVDNIASKADEAHTYPVEIRIANSTRYPLKAGMFARISFTSVAPAEALVIPRAALVGSIKNAQVYVVQNNKASLRSVVIGAQSGEFLEVQEGLKEGDVVVTNGQNNLSDSTSVVIVK